MKSIKKRLSTLEEAREQTSNIRETALAIFNKDGSVTVEWQSQSFKLKDQSEYEVFLNENELHGSPTNITVIEVRSIGEMPEVS